MDNYKVDDILDEIKRKKQTGPRQDYAPPSPAPENRHSQTNFDEPYDYVKPKSPAPEPNYDDYGSSAVPSSRPSGTSGQGGYSPSPAQSGDDERFTPYRPSAAPANRPEPRPPAPQPSRPPVSNDYRTSDRVARMPEPDQTPVQPPAYQPQPPASYPPSAPSGYGYAPEPRRSQEHGTTTMAQRYRAGYDEYEGQSPYDTAARPVAAPPPAPPRPNVTADYVEQPIAPKPTRRPKANERSVDSRLSSFGFETVPEDEAAGYYDTGGTTRIDIPTVSAYGAAGTAGTYQSTGRDLSAPPPSGYPHAEEPVRRRSTTTTDAAAYLMSDFSDEADPTTDGEIVEEIASQRTSLVVRLILTSICTIVQIYLAFSYVYPLSLPPFMFPENDLRMFLIVNVGVLVANALICANTVGGGIISLLTLKADHDSFAAMAVVASVIQGTLFAVSPQQYAATGVHLYLPVAALILFFNTLGKCALVNRIGKSFRFLKEEKPDHSLRLIANREFSYELTKGYVKESEKVAYSQRTERFHSFLDIAYSQDQTETVTRLAAPVVILAGIIMAVISYMLFVPSIFVSVSIFAAMGTVCAPFAATLAANLPMASLRSRLSKWGAMVPGYESVDQFGNADSVVLGCSDLFPKGSIELHGIKIFQKNRIDEAILDAASVICGCDSTLRPIFFEMIGGRAEILKKVETINYEDGMGLSAWVDGKRVLIGNRELMKHHGIDIPSLDYEAKYTVDRRQLLYLSNSGELTAMYVLTYNGDDTVAEALNRLVKSDINLIVSSTDPNVTAEKIDEIYGYPTDLVKVLPAKLQNEMATLTRPQQATKCYAAHNGTAAAIICLLRGTRQCGKAINTATLMLMASIILGFAITAFLAFMQSMNQMSWLAVIVYQIFWLLVTILIPKLRRA